VEGVVEAFALALVEAGVDAAGVLVDRDLDELVDIGQAPDELLEDVVGAVAGLDELLSVVVEVVRGVEIAGAVRGRGGAGTVERRGPGVGMGA